MTLTNLYGCREREMKRQPSFSTVQQGKFTITTTTHAREDQTALIDGLLVEQRLQGKVLQDLVLLCSRTHDELQKLQTSLDGVRQENARLRHKLGETE